MESILDGIGSAQIFDLLRWTQYIAAPILGKVQQATDGEYWIVFKFDLLSEIEAMQFLQATALDGTRDLNLKTY